MSVAAPRRKQTEPAVEQAASSLDNLIRAAFRVLLNREPEHDAVVHMAKLHASPEQVLRALLAAPEYHNKRPELLAALRRGLLAGALEVEVDVDHDVLRQLFERIQEQWQALGRSEPYWSVLTNDRYRSISIAEHRQEFEATGANSLRSLELTAARSGVALPTGTCVELGCGVGRVTRYLAGKFANVIAVDISDGNLEICRQYLTEAGVDNVELRLLRQPMDVEVLPACDMLYSLIVLQHNPPPVIKYFIKSLLGKIRSGGAAFLQVPTHTPGYAFSVASYLKKGPAGSS